MRVAFVTARFPPMDSTGTIRIAALRAGLGGHGLDTTFITIPPRLMAQQGSGLRARDVEHEPDAIYPSGAAALLIGVLSRIPITRRLVRWVMVPDVLRVWASQAGRVAAKELAEIDVVYATGPPFSAFAAARKLARLRSVPYVLELRDPPTMDRTANARGASHVRRIASFERKHILEAAAVVTLTHGVREHLLAEYSELDPERVLVVPNGALAADPSTADETERNPFTISYVGSLRGASDLEIMDRLASVLTRLDPPGRLRLVGSFPDWVESRLEPYYESGVVDFEGRVSRERALVEMSTCDAMLVLAGAKESWWVGRKVIEGLANARQILALCPQGDLQDLLDGSAKSVRLPRSASASHLEEAIDLLRRRSGQTPDLGDEPRVPSDADVTRSIAGLLRAVVGGNHLAKWSWDWSQ